MSKPNIVTIFCVVIMLLFGLFVHQANVAHKNKQKADALEETVSNQSKKAEISTLALNDSLKVAQANIEDLKVTLSNVKAKYSDLLSKANIKPKYVDRVTEIKTTIHDTDTVPVYVDKFGGLTAKLDDGYAKIDVQIDTLKRATIDYTVNDSLTIINYTKRHSLLFGLIKWNSYSGTRVITHNPKATPVTVISYSMIK